MNNYTPLHVHTSKGSLLDSTNTPDSLIKRAKEIGLKSIAITDHGYCSNHVEFYKKCKENNIKPILGMEGYIANDMTINEREQGFYHIILLAKNNKGYKNLLEISTLGHVKGFYYKPRVDLKTIRELKLGEGIIASSACLGSELCQMILKEESHQDILNKLQEYKNTFEEFYLELQPTNTADNEQTQTQQFVNYEIYKLAKETNTKMIATSDCHFTNKEDYELHNVFIQISQDRDNEVYENCWLKSYNEMLNGNYFGSYDKSNEIKKLEIDTILSVTNEIANDCNVELELGKSYIPSAELENHKNKENYFMELIIKGCKKRGFSKFDKEKKETYWDRILSEYEVLKTKGFIDYFLLEYNIIHTARKQGIIISPTARGSGAGSLICYVLEITNVDPIKYHLLFERFLTIEKKGLPDIDTDVATQDKDSLVDLIKDMYGHDKVAQISTFGTLQSKSAIQSIGKVLGIPYNTVEEIKKGITDGLSIKESLESNKDLQDYQELYPRLFEYALKLEGLERNISTHAGGVVITPADKKISDFCGMCISRRDEEITQLDMVNCEEVGLVKMDFLGLSTLDVIYDTYKIIKEHLGVVLELKPDEIAFDDMQTYSMLSKGHTKGVFQLGSKGITDACVELKPNNFDELTNLVSLYRPATLKALERYLKKKNGELEIESLEPRVDEVLSTTRGELIYQEQMMRLLKIMANFSDGEADHARKISSKKKVEEFEKVMQDFKKMALKNGFAEKVVNTVYDMIKDSASYSFALAHGVSYTMLTYITAYLKAHYTTEFMCSLLTNQRKEGSTDMESLNEYLKECLAMGITIKNPDLREKNFDFKVTGDKEITYGLELIKGCNKSELEELIKYDFKDFDEVLEVSCSKNTLIPLIKTGALDYLGERKDLLIKLLAYRYSKGMEKKKNLKTVNKRHYEKLLEEKKITLEDIPKDKNDVKRKEKILNIINKENKLEVWTEWKQNVIAGDYAIWEYQLLGYTISGELFEKSDKFKNFYDEDVEEIDLPCIVNKIDKKKIKKGKSKGQEMAILDLDSPFGEVRALAFANSWQTLKYKIDKGQRYILVGNKKDNQLLLTGIMSYERYIRNFKD
ncbi:DNA polymerase III subunit alpha [Peptoniphilus sp. MSJ-1]|uniref:DNA-directed DNA polymerase n=1 Tax=Peptoniphilus ovalis TaxID=2841503 RepID=A0ABS6FK55_9FIRM|nr:DNA polymerase III subunit alpha [Peptoniphilus ovalis]MBU5669585.1 DNA polymerase III subunit alpha [Peptoniphilus ovalis]